MIQSNILLTDVIIPKYDKFTLNKANALNDKDVPMYDNAIPTNLSLNTDSPSNDDVLPTYETVTVSPLSPGTGSIFPEDTNLLPRIDNLPDLLKHLSEVAIRFNTNPDYYMQDDFVILIKTITESLINIYINTPVTVDDFQILSDLVDTKVDKINNKDLSTNDYTNEDKSKLDGIETGANVNVQSDWLSTNGDSQILNKPNIPSLDGIATEEYVISYAQIKKAAGEYYINLDEKNNIHEPHSDDQDLSGLVVKIPGYSLVANSEIAKIHSPESDNQDLTPYETIVNNNIKLAGKEPANSNIQAHIANRLNPHFTTKSQIGLDQVDNTSDLNKPISIAIQSALDLKQNLLTLGNFTSTTPDITISNGIGAVIGSGITFNITTAGTTTGGLITSGHWNTFNNKWDSGNHPTTISGYGITDAVTGTPWTSMGYLTSITKAQVESVLTGLITTHTHNYLSSFTETDPIFTAWNKSTGISITKSQISDFPTIPTIPTNVSAFANDTHYTTLPLSSVVGDDNNYFLVYAAGGTNLGYTGGIYITPYGAVLNAGKFVTNNGTSSQFLKGDGSLDPTKYIDEMTAIAYSVVL